MGYLVPSLSGNKLSRIIIQKDLSSPDHDLIMEGYVISSLSTDFVKDYSPVAIHSDDRTYRDILPKKLFINEGEFTNQSGTIAFPTVSISQLNEQTLISCSCAEVETRFCEHQSQVLLAVLKDKDLLAFFDEKLRLERLKRSAIGYGLENEPDLENFFELSYNQKKLSINQRHPGLLPLTKEGLSALKHLLVTDATINPPAQEDYENLRGVVFKQHKYYKNLLVELFDAAVTKEGKIKNA